MIRNDKICVLLQKRQEEDLRKLSIKLNEFRKTYQTPDSSKEWDLNDPKAKNKDAPARISDDDPRCGVSSMQKFLGEDLSGKERKKIQQEQTRLFILLLSIKLPCFNFFSIFSHFQLYIPQNKKLAILA